MMAGYEIMPLDMDQAIDIDEVLDAASAMNDFTLDRIMAKYRAEEAGWRMFYRLHKQRKDPAHMGLLGIAKLMRAKRDAYAELLQEIVQGARTRSPHD
jgi:hypothetical protein